MILGIDTSTTTLSLALAVPGHEDQASGRCLKSQQRHNETILPQLETLLAEQDCPVSALTGIAVGLGPGSFTGVRIGIATAMGLGQSLGIPVAGVSSYLAIAAGTDAEQVVVAGDARQDLWYAAAFRRTAEGWQTLFDERLMTAGQLLAELPAGRTTLAGPEAAVLHPQLAGGRPDVQLADPNQCRPDAGWLIRLALPTVSSPVNRTLSQGGMPLADLVPIYLRKTQAEEVLEKKLRESDATP